MPTTSTPLRYPGGKSQLRPLVRELLQFANGRVRTYCEPFCGGAGVAIDLLLKEDVDDIYINDADPGIFAFWNSVINHPDELIRLIHDTPVDVNTWTSFRSRYSALREGLDRNEIPELELGFLTLYLNRTNVSGIIDGGCIGGMRQSGSSKIDSRFNKDTLTRKIEAIADKSNHILVSGTDGIEFLKQIEANHDVSLESLFVFLDPPYVQQGGNLYFNSMKATDHIDLADYLRESKLVNWILTYDQNPLILNLYQNSDLRELDITYSSNRRRTAKELIALSSTLKSFVSESRPMTRLFQ